ncbi:MAG: hypothetical protein JWQ75_3447 [Pseudarthrobacter sp.]|nr:hypothetical protein [Pseudarthrobacter sp.]
MESSLPPPSLSQLILDSGHDPSTRLLEAMRLAHAAQQQRVRIGVSNRKGITRTTALWALARVDPDVGAAMASAGVTQDALETVLGLRGSAEMGEFDGYPEPSLADALPDYLASLPARTVGTADLAAAILVSTQQGPGGMLPDRLLRLGIDYAAAYTALARIGAHVPVAADGQGKDFGAPEELFSESVRTARDRLGATATVTPSTIAAAIQQDHPEYADGGFGRATLRLPAGPTSTVEQWLERVRQLYDPGAVARSRHKMITGELMVLGLAELDQTLQEDLTAAGILDAWRSSVGLVPRLATSDRTNWSTDAPAEKDSLGRAYLAKALAERLRLLRGTRDSFLVQIDGPWGSGKSTLFRFLKSELEAKDFLIVEINAWREQQVGIQWWTLHNALREAVEADSPHPFWASLLSRVHVIQTRLFPFVATLIVLVAVVTGLLLLADLDLTTGGEIADSVGKIVSLVALTIAGVTASYRFLLPESRRSANSFVSNSANPMSEVRRLFARTLQRTKKPVAFLIDDLDRCDGDYIVEFLEVVQTLIRDSPRALHPAASSHPAAGPYAFIAADGQWIRSSYEEHYSSVRLTEVPGRPLGYLFLEKIFQLQVRLPAITDDATQTFYESLLLPSRSAGAVSAEQQALVANIREQVRLATTGQDVFKAAEGTHLITDEATRMEVRGTAAVKFSGLGIQAETSHELARYGRLLEPNPRSIRLFVNTFGILQSLRVLEGITVQSGPLALWTLVEIRWPLLADYLRAHPDDIDPGQAEDLPEAIAKLLADADVSAVINHPDGGPLTPRDVRNCTGRPAPAS